MSPSVLEQGTLHRRARREALRRARRRRRMMGFGLVLVVVMVGVVLARAGALNGARGPARSGAAKPAATAAAVKPSTPAPPAAGPYGRSLSARQLNVRVKGKLRAGMLFDVRTGQVLWQRSPERVLPIASLTKMMTALIVAAHAGPREPVMITRTAIQFSGSGVGLLPLGHHVQLETLLYGLLLPSGNDAAIALAEHVAGSQRHFVGMMNEEAQRMVLPCTRFASVSGIIDRGNHSCAADLAVLAHAVLTNPRLARIVGSASAVLPFPIKGGKLYLYNNNPLLLDGYPGTDGVKTGYTTASGPCLVAAARRGSAWYGVILLHSSDPRDQAQTLLNAAFAGTGRQRARS